MGKLKNKVINMNVKKGLISIIIAGIVFALAAGIGTGVKFGSRIVALENQYENQMEISQQDNGQQDNSLNQLDKVYDNNDDYDDYDKSDYYHGHAGEFERDWYDSEWHEMDWENMMNMSTSDYVFLGIMSVLGCLLFAIYWLWMTAYAVSKAIRVGASPLLFGWLTFLFNIAGVALLWIYIAFHNTCTNCGKIQSRSDDYCKYCGTVINITCPNCGEHVSAKDQYCKHCGDKISEEEV